MEKTQVQIKQDEFFDELLESIKPKSEEFIEKRIHHINFSKIICWLCVESRKGGFFQINQLRKFMRIDNSAIHRTLKGLVEADMLNKNHGADGKTSYSFPKDNRGNPKLGKYFEQALKTLGKKIKKESSIKIEQNFGEGYF